MPFRRPSRRTPASSRRSKTCSRTEVEEAEEAEAGEAESLLVAEAGAEVEALAAEVARAEVMRPEQRIQVF